MSFIKEDFALVFAATAVWFLEPFQSAGPRGRAAVDAPRAPNWSAAPGAPPGWLFGPAWAILYTLLTISSIAFLRDGTATAQYVWVPWVILANWITNKLWFPTFFGFRRPDLALLLILVCLGTAIAVAVGMAQAQTWLAFGTWILYPIWLAYATYLNWYAVA